MDIQTFSEKIIDNIEKVIVGKKNALELTLVDVLCKGHLLIEDVPGVGKTILARSLAKSLGCSFSRIQFTPDMLPGDVTGVSIFNQENRQFEYRPGPIVSQIILADEINRATPKTQAALLEAMEEKQITVDGETHILPDPFIVLATQNPIEYEGTFPLPEAQLDRFMMRISLGYPDFDKELEIMDRQQFHHPIESLDQVTSVNEVLEMQEAIKSVHIATPIRHYIVEITRQTRNHGDVYLGASTRGSLALFKAGQALAAIRGRDYVLPDDIKFLAPFCLSHRIILAPSARLRDTDVKNVVEDILRNVSVPGGDLKPLI
ncbi:MAG: MoxR family ATPase [Anaerolineales bacterium]|nr:MoxR family ATPase [Anaerolineales bacterium]